MPLLDHETQPLSPTTSDSIPVPQTLPLTAVEGSGDTNESDLRLESAKLAHGHDAILRDTTNIESSGTQNDQCICEVTVPSGLSPLDSPRTVLHVSGRDHTELLQMCMIFFFFFWPLPSVTARLRTWILKIKQMTQNYAYCR